jgi:hypothetical protein
MGSLVRSGGGGGCLLGSLDFWSGGPLSHLPRGGAPLSHLPRGGERASASGLVPLWSLAAGGLSASWVSVGAVPPPVARLICWVKARRALHGDSSRGGTLPGSMS